MTTTATTAAMTSAMRLPMMPGPAGDATDVSRRATLRFDAVPLLATCPPV